MKKSGVISYFVIGAFLLLLVIGGGTVINNFVKDAKKQDTVAVKEDDSNKKSDLNTDKIEEENKESEDNSKKEVDKNKEMVAKEQVSTIPKTGPSSTSPFIAPAMGFVVYLFVFGYKKLFD